MNSNFTSINWQIVHVLMKLESGQKSEYCNEQASHFPITGREHEFEDFPKSSSHLQHPLLGFQSHQKSFLDAHPQFKLRLQNQGLCCNLGEKTGEQSEILSCTSSTK